LLFGVGAGKPYKEGSGQHRTWAGGVSPRLASRYGDRLVPNAAIRCSDDPADYHNRRARGGRKDTREIRSIVESKYSIDPVENVVRLKWVGQLTVTALTLLMREIAAAPQYRAGMHAIADFRDSVGVWDYSEIQRFRDFVTNACGTRPRRWASIVRPGELEAVGRVLIVISEAVGARIRMQLFEDELSAERWVRAGTDE
jgi:hypothetical protein